MIGATIVSRHGRIEAVEEILPYSEAFEYLREFYDTETAVTQTISSTFEQSKFSEFITVVLHNIF